MRVEPSNLKLVFVALTFIVGPSHGLAASALTCASLFSHALPAPFDANLEAKIWQDLLVMYQEVQLEDHESRTISLRRLLDQKLEELSQGNSQEKSRLLKKLASEYDERSARERLAAEAEARRQQLGQQKKTTEWSKVPLNFKAAPIREVGEPIVTPLPADKLNHFAEALRDRWKVGDDDPTGSLDWSQDGRFLFLQASPGSKGFAQTYLYDLSNNHLETSRSEYLLMSRSDNVYVDRGDLWNTVVDLESQKVLYRFRGKVHPIREALGRHYVVFSRGNQTSSEVILRHTQTGEHVISANYLIHSQKNILVFIKDERLWQIDLVTGQESLLPGPWTQAKIERSKLWNSSGLGTFPMIVDGHETLLLAHNMQLVSVPAGFDRIMFTTGDNVLFGKDVIQGPNGVLRNFYLINTLYHAEYTLDGVDYASLVDDKRFIHFPSKSSIRPDIFFDLQNWKEHPFNVKYEHRYGRTHFLRLNPSTQLQTHVLHPFTQVEMKWTSANPQYPLDRSELWIRQNQDSFEIFDPQSDYSLKVPVADLTGKQIALSPNKKFLLVETRRGILLYPIQWREKPAADTP